MHPAFSGGNRPLPETLQDDLVELVSWDNNCFLTWAHLASGGEPEGSRWFTVLYSSDGDRFGLRLEFWIPEWMHARAVAAILPAHLEVTECATGERAVVDLGMRRRSGVLASVPKVARTCARLINELWGYTESDGVLLLTIEYQRQQLPVPFTELPGYGR